MLQVGQHTQCEQMTRRDLERCFNQIGTFKYYLLVDGNGPFYIITGLGPISMQLRVPFDVSQDHLPSWQMFLVSYGDFLIVAQGVFGHA